MNQGGNGNGRTGVPEEKKGERNGQSRPRAAAGIDRMPPQAVEVEQAVSER